LGAISYVRSGRYLHASGGLLAPDEHKESLLAQFITWADENHLHLTFYNIADADLPLLRRYGFQATKWGEESLVDLVHCTWEGKAFEWVRRQSNYCRRQGLAFSEADRTALSAGDWEIMLRQINEVWPAPLAGKPQAGEIKFMEGSFDPARIGRKRIFLATADEGRGRIEGVLVANPAAGGTTWVFETYRHRPDAPRGCVSFLMHQALLALQAEGVPTASLCLVPGLGCDRPTAGDSMIARWGLVIGSRYANFIFDSAGLYHFKTRFRPQFEARYLCARPRVTLGSFASFIKVLGVLNLDLGKLARVVSQRVLKAGSRATMSTAEKTPAAS
jgi:phosphatidylglycerol lysyltransferase